MSDTGGGPAPDIGGVLRSPRWWLYGLVAVGLAVTMVFLGVWQLHRYQLRSSINERIDAAATARPVPVTELLRAGRRPGADEEYTRVRLTGRYDPAHQMLARTRTVDGHVGYEVLVPLRLAGGGTVLVDRGWLPPGGDSPVAEPEVPAAPTGTVTVVGRLRLPESGAGPVTWRNGHVEVRRIDPGRLASALPYRVYGGYVTLTGQTPAASRRFVAIPVDHENAAMNLAYIVQWWLFAGMTLVGYGMLVRWEARRRAGLTAPDRTVGPSRLSEDRV